MTQLSYLEMVDDRGRAVIANGVVQSDQVDTLGEQRDLHGRGVRLYAAEATDDGQSLASLRRLLLAAPSALQSVLTELRTFVQPLPAPAVLVHSHSLSRQFASLDPVRHRVQVLDLGTSRSLDELVGGWARKYGRDHLLVEFDATKEALEALMQEFLTASIDPVVRDLTTAPATRTVALPAENAASAARRQRLAQNWLDAGDVSSLLGSRAENTSQLPNRLRREGRLLGVWVVGENRYRFPPWQFTPTGQVVPEMRALLALLRSPRGVAGGRQTSGWEEIEWLCAPHARLDKQRPADLLATAPERVLETARHEFTEDMDAGW